MYIYTLWRFTFSDSVCNAPMHTDVIHPSTKVMADVFQKQNSTRCLHPICMYFVVYKCMYVTISNAKFNDILYQPVMHQGSQCGECVFLNQVSIIVNFMEWNLTYSNENSLNSNSRRFLNRTKISWRWVTLLQNHHQISVGHCVSISVLPKERVTLRKQCPPRPCLSTFGLYKAPDILLMECSGISVNKTHLLKAPTGGFSIFTKFRGRVTSTIGMWLSISLLLQMLQNL